MTAVKRSCVIVPITPPAFTIFVESISDASVVTTRPRAIGMLDSAETKNRMAAGVHAVVCDGGYRARGVHREIALDQHHADHVAGR